MPKSKKRDMKGLTFSGGRGTRLIHKKGEKNWTFTSYPITPENPMPISTSSKNVVISIDLLQTLVNQVYCSSRTCNAQRDSQELSLEFSGVTCSRLTYHCKSCGHTNFAEDSVGIIPNVSKSYYFQKTIKSIKEKKETVATGGPTRVAWFEANIQLALSALLNGIGDSELETLTCVMNFPNPNCVEKQFHRIEKEILIPGLLELQDEVLLESIVEEAQIEMKKIGQSKEI